MQYLILRVRFAHKYITDLTSQSSRRVDMLMLLIVANGTFRSNVFTTWPSLDVVMTI